MNDEMIFSLAAPSVSTRPRCAPSVSFHWAMSRILRSSIESAREAEWPRTPASAPFGARPSSVASTFEYSILFHSGGCVWVITSWSWAFSQTLRASGSETSSFARLSCGSSCGTNGSTSYGSSTSLAMFSMMRAQLRLVAVTFSSRPRLRSGHMIARSGSSASGEPSPRAAKAAQPRVRFYCAAARVWRRGGGAHSCSSPRRPCP